MKCPIDNVDLVMSERHGIEIDYCPTCRGVWLDRGELDKIIDRAAGPAQTQASAPSQGQFQPQPQSYQNNYRPSGDHRPRDNDRYRDDERHRHKRKESFLGELFDF